MSKISSYGIVSPPVAGDIVIGTDVSNANKTKNFRVEDIAALAATPTLSLVLASGNTAINNISLTGNLSIIGASSFNGSNQFGPNGTTDFGHLVEFDNINLEGTVRDGAGGVGTAGQVLSSTGTGVAWVNDSTPIPTLTEVLTAGNTTSNLGLILGGASGSITVGGGQSGFLGDVDFIGPVEFESTIEDGAGSVGTAGQVLSSTGTGVAWVNDSTLSMTAQTITGQTPSALDTALQIKFGSAQTTTSVSIDANGLITFLEAGDYRLNVNCCFLRNAISGYSNTQFGIFYNSAGGAPTVAASPIKSFTSDERQRPYMYYEDLVIKVVANSTLVVKMLNDTSLTSDNLTALAPYAGTLGTTPSASVLIYSQ